MSRQMRKYFLSFSFMCIGISLFISLFLYIKYNEKINALKKFENIEQKIFENLYLGKNFLLIDAKRVDFHESLQSTTLDKKRHSDERLKKLFNSTFVDEKLAVNEQDFMKRTNELITEQRVLFDKIVEKLVHRGMKDFGQEGKMREYAHKLEEDDLIDPADLLMLRRHEKDYIIRGQDEYIIKAERRVQEIKIQSRIKRPHFIN